MTKTIKRDWGEMKKNCVVTIYRHIRSSMDREAIEHLLSIQKLPQWIKKLSRSYRD